MSNEVSNDRNPSSFLNNFLDFFSNRNQQNIQENAQNNNENNDLIGNNVDNDDIIIENIQIISNSNERVNPGINNFEKNQLTLKPDNFEDMILIKNPNNEVAVGLFLDHNNNNEDQENTKNKIENDENDNILEYNKNKEVEIENYYNDEKNDKYNKHFKCNKNYSYNKDKDFDNKSTCSEKVVTLQTYEAIPQATLEQILNLVDPRNSSLLNPISQQRFFSYKIESLLIKYTIFVISLMMFVIDLKTIRNRFLNDDSHISKMRVIFIQMNDSQLIQLFYSFLAVYIIMSISCLFIGLLSLVYDSISMIKVYMNITCMSIIFLFLELNTKNCDLILIVLKFIILALSRKWLQVNIKLFQAILLNPEYLEFNRI